VFYYLWIKDPKVLFQNPSISISQH